MAPSLKAPGSNKKTTFQALVEASMENIRRLPLPQAVPITIRLLPSIIQIQSPEQAAAFIQLVLKKTVSGVVPVVLWASLAEHLAADHPASARLHLQNATNLTTTLPTEPAAQCQAWSTIGRAHSALQSNADSAFEQAWTAALRSSDPTPLGRLLVPDLLAVSDLDGALRAVNLLLTTPTTEDNPLFVALCNHLYAAGRLIEAGPIVQQRGDLLDHVAIFQAATEAPIQALDVDACFQLIAACSPAYRADLLEMAALRWVDMGRIGVVHDVLKRWEVLQPGSVVRLGLLAMLDDGPAREQLDAELKMRLEVEEVAFHNTWRYRELGRACAWAGNLSGTLSALECVIDHIDRMSALLSATRYAPLAVREPLLCAARGLAASMQDDRHRAASLSQLATLQISLDRRRIGLSMLEEASRLAMGIRRPRSDQGFARRAALESVIAAQLTSDDNLGAFKTTRKLRTRHMRNPHLARIAARYAEQGDPGGVLCCMENMHPDAILVETGVVALRRWLEAGQPEIATEAA